MTIEELHDVVDNENCKISKEQLFKIIVDIQKDCLNDMSINDTDSLNGESWLEKSKFLNGERSAFQIVLDLLEHLED